MKLRACRVLVLASLLAVLPATVAHAQAATVAYDYSPPGASVAQTQAWTPTLYVNGTPFTMVHTCVAGIAPILVTCTAPLPNITAALTPSGNQTFTVSLKDSILGESPQSAPLTRIRPSAPLAPRIT